MNRCISCIILVDNIGFCMILLWSSKILPCHFNKILPWIHDSAKSCQDVAMISTKSCHDFDKVLPWFQQVLVMISTISSHDFDKILPWFQQYILPRFQQYILPWFWQDLVMISTRSCHLIKRPVLFNEHATSQNPVWILCKTLLLQ